ncbi:response regulator [Microbacterium sp. NPDC089696]|uniref:response regulator n=1 Tax=Microbacterium sp. NPDC089696 TaxID=3364199 RepID=UPI00381DEBFF
MSLPIDVAPVRVLIVDDESLIRSGFRFVLGVDPQIEIVAEASDGAAAIELVRRHRPDVVLMDVRMPVMSGPDATAVIVAETSSKVVAMTSMDAEGQLMRMLFAGASGYLLKDEAPSRILEAVHRAAAGDAVFSARSTAQLVRRAVEGEGGVGRRNAVDRMSVLTDREREVAVLVASGATNQEIGTRLHIASGTVKTHLEQIYAKLFVRNRVQVGVIVERAGLGPSEL